MGSDRCSPGNCGRLKATHLRRSSLPQHDDGYPCPTVIRLLLLRQMVAISVIRQSARQRQKKDRGSCYRLPCLRPLTTADSADHHPKLPCTHACPAPSPGHWLHFRPAPLRKVAQYMTRSSEDNSASSIPHPGGKPLKSMPSSTAAARQITMRLGHAECISAR